MKKIISNSNYISYFDKKNPFKIVIISIIIAFIFTSLHCDSSTDPSGDNTQTLFTENFNGEILKIGPCDVLAIDSHLLAKTIEGLYFPTCPYRFDVIGVELLGSIYERYLGKTIRVTPKRVKIEEKHRSKEGWGSLLYSSIHS